jgi:UDP-N-acetylmuramate dehydrogenase
LAESLQALNSLQLCATAPERIEVFDLAQLRAVLARCAAAAQPITVLGDGSNVVLRGELPGPVLRYRRTGCELLARDSHSVLLRVHAGQNWHALTEWALDQGFYGLENLALIPGSAGAAPVQNIGAYGVELAQLLHSVHGLMRADASPFTLSAQDCQFAYRDSIFKHAWRDACVITAIDLRLRLRDEPCLAYPALSEALAQKHCTPTAHTVFQAVVALRRARLPDPAVLPNAGSFFHNPVVDAAHAGQLSRDYPQMPRFPQPGGRVKLAAGWLIEQCGWKGYTGDGVGVHAEHALVLLNLGADDAQPLLALAERIRHSVAARFGCQLQIEPRIYPESQAVPANDQQL